MQLIAFHRLLIGTAIVFGLGFSVWELLRYRQTGEVQALLTGAISLVVSLLLAYYLKNLKRFLGVDSDRR